MFPFSLVSQFTIVLVCLSLYSLHTRITLCAADNWNYDYSTLENPDHWADSFPSCAGKKQSPIDIDTESVYFDGSLSPLNVNWLPQINGTITNNGHTIQFNAGINDSSTIQSGNLPRDQIYKFVQLHIHYNSEHTVDKSSYPLELHVLHINSNSTIGADNTDPRQLAVIGLLFHQTVEDNLILKPITDLIPSYLMHEGNTTSLSSLDLSSLYSSLLQQGYFSYPGSLTIPGCRETVTWHVLPISLGISGYQLQIFREALEQTSINRPVQPLNARKVVSNIVTYGRNADIETAVDSINEYNKISKTVRSLVIAVLVIVAVTLAFGIIVGGCYYFMHRKRSTSSADAALENPLANKMSVGDTSGHNETEINNKQDADSGV